ncbi:Ethanolamine-phosphate cytidylyltransferase [Physocladia obscura]|uniref:ethanolamine-phosphate cytidylyltransferase n=1 Tax=Physocladia obscura TaxID=109957 RepID=A0AAD5T057_9FUNG|nr:Ethanolamine-phosphate cytidylyltransferase [Physocladia obscura]
MGGRLVVGVHSDAEILKNKGPTVMTEKERYDAVAACKWVDQVVPNAPYLTSLEWMDKYNCDVCVHGDDITTMADGTDCYQVVKDAGRYWECKRTQGVSTTELVGRMLLNTNEHLRKTTSTAAAQSPFLPTSQKIVQFSNGKEAKSSDRVVYVSGAFDLFHVGHTEFLKRVKQEGDYLLVGIHDDDVVNKIMGSTFPIMNLHERALSVLQCKYVDEIIMGAPYSVTKDVLNKICKVAIVVGESGIVYEPDLNGSDPFKLPKELGIYKEVEVEGNNLSTEIIIDRIIANRKLYEARNKRKMEKAALEERMLEEQQAKK